MNQLEQTAQQMAHNTRPRLHSVNCPRKIAPEGQVVAYWTPRCNCWVFFTLKDILLVKYPGEWATE